MNIKRIMDTLLEQPPKSSFSGIFSRIKFFLWCIFVVKKNSHKRRLKQARRVLRLLNRNEFRENPSKLFGYLRKIDPFTFEEVLLLCFKVRGFKVRYNQAYTGDGGVDGLVIFPDKSHWLIQAKRYEHHINLAHVKDFGCLMQKMGVNGIFIHTGRTGGGVYHNLGKNILLLSGGRLHQFVSYALG